LHKYDASIVLAGAAGQGIETVAAMLATAVKNTGFNVFVSREFMSRIRGGTNSLQLRISSDRKGAYVRRTDIAIPLSENAVPHLERYSRLNKNTLLIGEKEYLDKKRSEDSGKSIEVPFSEIAKEVGSKIYANTVAAGVIGAIFSVESDLVHKYLTERFENKGEKIVQQNKDAYDRGYEIGLGISKSEDITFSIKKSDATKDELIVSGTEAAALGAIAGGCNFIASYPMSPSTGVLTFLAQHAPEFSIIVDQTEDEISAMNKGIGAWYAGARAMVTTSGGGFALMTEGLSLAGMVESPMVIHLAQRPGPATGLPTRTAQGDLRHVINASHGEFPRAVFAPSSMNDAFVLTQNAFNLAAKYQVPVFILTDQFLVDSSSNTPVWNVKDLKIEPHIVKTAKDYQRYLLTDNGISPRGIPGNGEGTVVADSDEHDEDGHITEDLNLSPKMARKRLSKFILLRDAFVKPTFEGPPDYRNLVISWGSTYYAVKEAVEELESDDTALMHFSQVYPLPEDLQEQFERADNVMLVENNYTGQFADVILTETGFRIDDNKKLLHASGLPLSVEEIKEFMQSIITKEGK
jgi:2-oxoglutarate ferredoxin oxidoreductase subunit alpha